MILALICAYEKAGPTSRAHVAGIVDGQLLLESGGNEDVAGQLQAGLAVAGEGLGTLEVQDALGLGVVLAQRDDVQTALVDDVAVIVHDGGDLGMVLVEELGAVGADCRSLKRLRTKTKKKAIVLKNNKITLKKGTEK